MRTVIYSLLLCPIGRRKPSLSILAAFSSPPLKHMHNTTGGTNYIHHHEAHLTSHTSQAENILPDRHSAVYLEVIATLRIHRC
jgi:hypothetical protein